MADPSNITHNSQSISEVSAVIPGGSWEDILLNKETNLDPVQARDPNLQQQYLVRTRRSLKETADFFKNLPALLPSKDDAYININSNPERIVAEVMARPYSNPFAQSQETEPTDNHNHHEGLSYLLTLLEQADNYDKQSSALFDGEACQSVEVQIVSSGSAISSQRSAYSEVRAAAQAKAHSAINKSKSWGNNLYVQLSANNAPEREQASSSLWGEVSQALSSLLGFNAIESASANLLTYSEVGDFQKLVQGRKCCTFNDQVIVSTPSDPLYLMPVAGNNSAKVQHQQEIEAMSNNQEQALEHPVIRAFSGKNELNGQVSNSGLSRASENERRLERQISSYFMPSDYAAKYLASNHREVQPADIIAYGMFKQWMRRRSALLLPDGSLEEGNEATLYEVVLLLVQTMIFAMRADGRIETKEHNSLIDFCRDVVPKQLYNNIRGEVDRLLTIDLDPELLAKQVKYPEENIDIYLLSAVLLSNSHFLELGYLESLAACLGIDPSLRRNLDDNARSVIANSAQLIAKQN